MYFMVQTRKKIWDPCSHSLMYTALLSHTDIICKKEWYSGNSAVHWIRTSQFNPHGGFVNFFRF